MRTYRVVEHSYLDPGLRPGFHNVLQAFGEAVRPPNEVLMVDGIPRSLHILDQARIEHRRILLNRHTIPSGERGVGIAPHEMHEFSAAGTVLFEPGNFCILAGQYGSKKRQRVPFQILPKEITLLAEGFPIPAEQEIDEQADPWREEKGQHPGQGGLRAPILQHEE